MSIQSIGRSGGRSGALKMKSGFDYYRFSYERTSSSASTFWGSDGLTFGSFIRFVSGVIDLAVSINLTVRMNPGSIAYEFPCSSTSVWEINAFNGPTELFKRQICPVFVGADETKEVSGSEYLEISGSSLEFRQLGGSTGRGIPVFHQANGIFRINSGGVRDVATSGALGFGNVKLIKLN